MTLSPISSSSWLESLAKPAATLGARVIAWIFFKKIQQNYTGQKTRELATQDFASKTSMDLKLIPMAPPVDLFSGPEKLLWWDDKIKISIVNENGRYHLLAKPFEEVSFEQIDDDHFVTLKQTVASISVLFEKVLGIPDFCEVLVESNRTFGYELIPAVTKGDTELELLNKDQRNLYFLSRGRLQSYSLPEDWIDELEKAIPTVFCPKPKEPDPAVVQKINITSLWKLFSSQKTPRLDIVLSIFYAMLEGLFFRLRSVLL